MVLNESAVTGLLCKEDACCKCYPEQCLKRWAMGFDCYDVVRPGFNKNLAFALDLWIEDQHFGRRLFLAPCCTCLCGKQRLAMLPSGRHTLKLLGQASLIWLYMQHCLIINCYMDCKQDAKDQRTGKGT